ncbi:hypothetical protein INT47_009072 [Mucor saturninus]|uniref:Phosphatidylglycerol/phosphatidylinositol transfer protein n=1 Tax=Mucor saturninus TaxID=64648 RepID=A0A8H7VG87_9FUNG|nr:hypothetical protein INT47_009072 [Mucor saturninus]
MKSSNWALSTIIFLIINGISASLIYWPSHSYSSSYQLSGSRASNVHITDCSSSDFVLHIHSVKISPEIVTAGGELTIEASGTLDEPVVPGASADVTVKLGVVKLLHKTFDICEELEKKKDEVELQCPIKDGYLTLTQKVTLPKEVPKAKFSVLVHAYTADEKRLACLQVMVDFRVHPSNRLLHMFEQNE